MSEEQDYTKEWILKGWDHTKDWLAENVRLRRFKAEVERICDEAEKDPSCEPWANAMTKLSELIDKERKGQ